MAEKIIICPNCQQQLSIAEEYLGMAVECPTCSTTFTAKAQDRETAAPVQSTMKDKLSSLKEKTKLLGSKIKSEAEALSNTVKEDLGNLSNKKDEYSEQKNESDSADTAKTNSLNDHYILKCRKICKKYFSSLHAEKKTFNFLSIVADGFEYAFFIILIIKALFKKNSAAVVECFRELRNSDIDFLEKLDVLPRYGKRAEQLAAKAQTLYAPAIGDDDDDFKYALVETDNNNFEYIYSTEVVTKVYTFEDQLFVYNGLWDYTFGQITHESTDAFFFKDITNINSENNYVEIKSPRPPFDLKGNILKIVNFLKRYKKLIFLLLITAYLVTTFFHFAHGNKNNISKEIRDHYKNRIEKRFELLTYMYDDATKLSDDELFFLQSYKLLIKSLKGCKSEFIASSQKEQKEDFISQFAKPNAKEYEKNQLAQRFDKIINDYKDKDAIELTDFDLEFLHELRKVSYYDRASVIFKFKDKYIELPEIESEINWEIRKELLECFGEDILCTTAGILIFYIAGCIIFIIVKLFIWLFTDYGSEYFRKSESLTITAKSGNKISITMLCDEWLEANHGILTGQRSDAEKTFHAIRKMIEEKKVAADE